MNTALSVLRTNSRISKSCNHIIYAYRIKGMGSTILSGHDDDREYGSSIKILELMRRLDIEGIVIISKSDGKRIKDRNKVLCELVQQLLNIEEDEETADDD